MATDSELLAAEILMVLCFIPVALWMLLTGWEYVAHRWVRPYVRRLVSTILFRYRRDAYFREWRANVRGLR